MMTEAKRYKVTLGGQTFTLVGDEPQELIEQAAMRINALLVNFTGGPNSFPEQKIALLALLQTMLEVIRLEQVVTEKELSEQTLNKEVERILATF